ncbi:MAG: winged helix-turn-helix transcriptional regulator [Candidatus Thorarchaeota archaeon]
MGDKKNDKGLCLAPLLSVVRLLGRVWTIPLILVLGKSGSSMRYSEIREQLITISDKEVGDSTLSKKLSELTEIGILSRKSFAEVPLRVEYSLSDAGQALFLNLNDLGAWAREECHGGGLKIPQARKPLQDLSPVESI